MKKPLSEMSLDELWQLFPIYLTKHNPSWQDWYYEERNHIIRVLPKDGAFRISHIGSTAVNTIWAKPIIDILVEVEEGFSFSEIRKAIELIGYICMSESKHRLSFNKGYTIDGFADKVFHLHLRYSGDNDELYFRDYLIEHPQIAKEYENLKLELWKKFEHNRDAYTESKTDFIRAYTQKAKELYNGRY